ncbi:MAG: ankyrin repeat domain-containing protein [Chlamydiae bacterium]|nr:ankyrin repeat domain-containing protein [Chlamydiota bacterium]
MVFLKGLHPGSIYFDSQSITIIKTNPTLIRYLFNDFYEKIEQKPSDLSSIEKIINFIDYVSDTELFQDKEIVKKVENLFSKIKKIPSSKKLLPSPLLVATEIKQFSIEEFRALFFYFEGEKKSFRDLENNSLFHIAAKKGDLEKVIFLYPFLGCEQMNDQGLNPFDLACLYKNEEVAKFFIKKDSSLLHLKHKEEKTILHIACGMQVDCKFLLKLGAGIEAKDEDGNTPLHISCSLLDVSNVLHLLNEDAKFSKNKKGQYPFELALDQSSVCHFLNKLNEEIGLSSLNITPPLLASAFSSSNSEAIDYLNVIGTNETETRDYLTIHKEYKGLLFFYLYKKEIFHLYTLLSSIDRDIRKGLFSFLTAENLNCSDIKKNTLLHYTIIYKNLELALELLQKQANFWIKNDQDQTILDLIVPLIIKTSDDKAIEIFFQIQSFFLERFKRFLELNYLISLSNVRNHFFYIHNLKKIVIYLDKILKEGSKNLRFNEKIENISGQIDAFVSAIHQHLEDERESFEDCFQELSLPPFSGLATYYAQFFNEGLNEILAISSLRKIQLNSETKIFFEVCFDFFAEILEDGASSPNQS